MGVAVKDIVERVGAPKATVSGRKKRYAAEGIGALADRPKPGRRPVMDEVEVVLVTLEPARAARDQQWSSRLLAEVAMGAARAAGRERVWEGAGVPVQGGKVVLDLDAT